MSPINITAAKNENMPWTTGAFSSTYLRIAFEQLASGGPLYIEMSYIRVVHFNIRECEIGRCLAEGSTMEFRF